MAKKTVSFSLENDLIKMIDEVQKQKELSSRSAALERILIHFKYVTSNPNDIIISKEDQEVQEGNDTIADAVKAAYKDMPD